MSLPANLTDFTLAEARDAVHQKKVSSKELTTAFVKAVAEARPLNAFVTETPERALEMAIASDVRIAHGEARPLEGLPLAIDRKSTRLNSSHSRASRMPSSA